MLVVKFGARQRWMLVAVGVVAAGAYYYLTRPESLEAAGSRVVEAIENGDAKTLLRYMSDEEKEFTGANEETLRTFLVDFVRPKLSGFKHSIQPIYSVGEDASFYSQVMRHADSRTTSISVVLERRGGRARTREIISGAAWAAFRADWPPDRPYPIDFSRKVFAVQSLNSNLAKLEATGIRGVEIRAPGPVLEYRTWREYRQSTVDSVHAKVAAGEMPASSIEELARPFGG